MMDIDWKTLTYTEADDDEKHAANWIYQSYCICIVFVFSEYRKIDNDEEVEGAVPDQGRVLG